MDFTKQNGIHTSGDIPNGSISPKSLSITIVGAGIGGLSAAIFLRQQGHHVTLLEQSRFANELGAAIHLAPNANGLLRRMGLYAEETGANPSLRVTQYLPNGKELFSVDVTKDADMWQHPWLLAHRVHLHSELKRVATAEEGKGKPAVLRTSSRVVDVNTEGRVTLASGEVISADVVIGADGVHSKTREKLPGAQGIKPFGSGKSAFRFLIPRKKVLADPDIKRYAEKDGHLQMIMGRDRRVIIYPTSNNELLNFVCIHPTAESEIKKEEGSEWNQQGNLSKMLEVYKDFEPGMVKLLGIADEETLKVWELLDMENLPTWCDRSLVCIGDAAHPFTPHQGQGGGQAIEDAASLAVVLPLGTPIEEIPERLKLYEKCRYERASKIQEFSRIVGRDLDDGPKIDANKFAGYNFGHDEWDYSTQQLRKLLYSRKPHLYWRMPIPFGPMPGPRQDVQGNAHNGKNSMFSTASIKFKTSRTLLQNLFPTEHFQFSSLATVACATFSVTTLGSLDWLGGKGYSHFGLYIHGVEYKKETGDVVRGTYLPILFENLADPILSGREELGMPKLYCELNIQKDTVGVFSMNAGWMGSKFCDMQLSNLEEATEQTSVQPETKDEEGLLWYKYFPKTGASGTKERGQADVEYAAFLSDSEEMKVEKKVEKTWRGKGRVIFDALDSKRLPTLHHITERLAEIPMYEVVEVKVVEGRGVSDVASARRLD